MIVQTPVSIQPLESGDLLTRDEFERRYEALPNVRAELVEGVVFVSSPVRAQHGTPHGRFMTWVGHYEAFTPGVLQADNTTVRLDQDNEYQPDSLLMIAAEPHGQARIGAEDYVEGAPEWVGEISVSSVSIDMHAKLRVYRRNGVREYVVWRVADQAIDWFVLRGSKFEPLAADSSGIFKSEVFPGLWLDAPALLRGDMQTVLRVLDQGIATPEHAALVAKLSQS